MRRLLPQSCCSRAWRPRCPAGLTLPVHPGSLSRRHRDSGTGESHLSRCQAAGCPAASSRSSRDHDGDNLYGGNGPRDYRRSLRFPTAVDHDGVKFYARSSTRRSSERFYKPFNMNGERYYSFKPGEPSVRFFALDSNYMDDKQIAWLDKSWRRVVGVEDLLFPHRPIRPGSARVGSRASRPARAGCLSTASTWSLPATALYDASSRRRESRIHRRELGQAAGRKHRGDHHLRQRLRHRVHLHARGDQRRRSVFPDDHGKGRDRRFRQRPPQRENRTVAGSGHQANRIDRRGAEGDDGRQVVTSA